MVQEGLACGSGSERPLGHGPALPSCWSSEGSPWACVPSGPPGHPTEGTCWFVSGRTCSGVNRAWQMGSFPDFGPRGSFQRLSAQGHYPRSNAGDASAHPESQLLALGLQRPRRQSGPTGAGGRRSGSEPPSLSSAVPSLLHSSSDPSTWRLVNAHPAQEVEGSFMGYRRLGSPPDVWTSALVISFLLLFFFKVFLKTCKSQFLKICGQLCIT